MDRDRHGDWDMFENSPGSRFDVSILNEAHVWKPHNGNRQYESGEYRDDKCYKVVFHNSSLEVVE